MNKINLVNDYIETLLETENRRGIIYKEVKGNSTVKPQGAVKSMIMNFTKSQTENFCNDLRVQIIQIKELPLVSHYILTRRLITWEKTTTSRKRADNKETKSSR